MGLIEAQSVSGRGLKKPMLTSLGKAVYLEDRYISEEITQWIVHMNLCRADTGALGWNATFSQSRSVLGSRFGLQQLEEYLVSKFGTGNDRTGPLIRTYMDDAALGRIKAIEAIEGNAIRRKVPILDAYAWGFSAFLLDLIKIGRASCRERV